MTTLDLSTAVENRSKIETVRGFMEKVRDLKQNPQAGIVSKQGLQFVSQDCFKNWTLTLQRPFDLGYKLSLDQIAFICELFYGGLSLRRVSAVFRDRCGLPISPPTIFRRVVEWVEMADEATMFLMKNRKLDFKLYTGDIWEIDEIYFKVKEKRAPLIVVRDLKTSFCVSRNLVDSVTSKAVKVTLASAKDLAHKCPRELRCDGHAAYHRAVRAVFRGKTKLAVNKRVGGRGMNQSIEGTFSVLRGRLRGMRSLHSLDTSPVIVKGLILDHNFVRSSVVLGNRTPAELALRWKPLNGKGGWFFLLRLADYYRKGVLDSQKRKHNRDKFDQTSLDTFCARSTGLRPPNAE